MKTIFLVSLGIVILCTVIACDDKNTTKPAVDKTDLGKGIFINKSETRPIGIDTLFINKSDTVRLTASTILLKPPVYSWISGDEKIFKVEAKQTGDSVAFAIAMGDSGATTTLKIIDSQNNAEKTITVVIVKYWADPDFYIFLGSLNRHYYYLSKIKRIWPQCVDLSEQAGGYLATITSREENELLHNGRMGLAENVWIGLTFLFGNDKLTHWITGEQMVYENFYSKPGDPGIFAEYYFYMQSDGRWENWHEITYNYFLEME